MARFCSIPSNQFKPAIDGAVKAWRETLRSVPDDTWVELKIPVPAQGCMNLSFDPVNHCLVMLGGCGGPMFGTSDDIGYNNQVWLLDMQVGKYYLRRAHHVWGPQDKDFQNTRMGPGCTRGNCFDSVRNVHGENGEGYADKDLRSLLGQPVVGRFSTAYCGNGSLAACRTRFLLLSFSSDWRFGTAHSERIERVLRRNGVPVARHEVLSPYGHDSFLLDVPEYLAHVQAFIAGLDS